MPYFRHLRRRHASRVRHSRDIQMRAAIVGHVVDLAGFIGTQNARLSVALAFAAGTLTLGANPGDGKVVVIGSKTYTFQTVLTNVDGHVLIGASAAASATNLFHAINATGGTVGTDYATATTAHADVTALNPSAGVVTVRAKTAGAAANAKATTSDVVSAVWGAVTLTGGADLYVFNTLDRLKRNTAAAIAAAPNAGSLS